MTINVSVASIEPLSLVGVPFAYTTTEESQERRFKTRPNYIVRDGSTLNRKRNFTYSDISLTNTIHPNTGDISKLYDVNSIKQSVKNLVLTNTFERPFRSNLGGNVSVLFELDSVISTSMIKTRIENLLKNFEPRAILIDVTAVSEENNLDISITFKPINSPQPATVNVFLQQVR